MDQPNTETRGRFGLTSGKLNQLYGLADQVVVSAANFLAVAIVARFSDLEGVGLYALAVTLMVMMSFLQDSLITRPYAVTLLQPAGSAKQHAGSALLLSLSLSSLIVGLGLILWLVSPLFPRLSELALHTALALTFAAPALLVREFSRRHAFSAQKSQRALLIDLIVSTIALGALIGLGQTGYLTAPIAILTLGLGSAVGALIWWLRHARDFEFSRASFRGTAASNWKVGKWFSLNELAVQLVGYTNHWLSLIIIGAAATGAFAEAMTVVALANPFIYGVMNVLMPKLVRTLHEYGREGLIKLTKRYMMFMAGTLALYAVFVAVLGEPVQKLVFKHQTEAIGVDMQQLMTLLSLAFLVGATGAPMTAALQSEKRGPELARWGWTLFAFSMTVAPLMMKNFGLIGAGYAFLLTEVFNIAGRSWLFFKKKPPHA